MVSLGRVAGGSLMLVLVVLALPGAAFGQATRTWVSGVGDDANPCSRTAPCKTFAGAISKTAAKGEINCLDPGGFGGVTITKSVAIDCETTHGGVLVSGTNAIVVNAAATDKVILRGLDINGIGTGLNGVRILLAKSVLVQRTKIFGFVRNGVDFEPSNSVARLVVSRTRIYNNTGNGVLVAPPSGGLGKATVRDSEVEENGCGIAATNHLPDPAFAFATRCGTQAAGVGGRAVINAYHSAFNDSTTTGVFANGNIATIRLSGNEVTSNATGLSAIDSGQILSWQNNFVADNSTDGNPTGTLTPK